MHYTYVLRSRRDEKLYVGFTSDLRRRIKEHQDGISKATRSRGPFELIFYEAYKNKYDALRRERYFKTSKGRSALKYLLREYFNESRQ